MRKLTDLSALRFDIEELFRDTKNEHLRWCLGQTRVTKADRLDRLIQTSGGRCGEESRHH